MTLYGEAWAAHYGFHGDERQARIHAAQTVVDAIRRERAAGRIVISGDQSPTGPDFDEILAGLRVDETGIIRYDGPAAD